MQPSIPIAAPASALDRQALHLLHQLDILVHRFLAARLPEDQVPNITPVDFQLLLLVSQSGAITMTDLAERLEVPLSTATNRVDRLVKRDLLQRLRSESDRRVVEITLTAEGQQLVSLGQEIRLTMGRAMLQALSPGEREILIELMQKMATRAIA